MSTQSNTPSFYIPFVFTQTTDEKIKTVMEVAYEFGKVKYIDRVLKVDADGKPHYSLYIHFETFNYDERTEKFLKHAADKNDPPRLYYDYGKSGYWKVMINTQVGKHTEMRVKIDYDAEPEPTRPAQVSQLSIALGLTQPYLTQEWFNDNGVFPVMSLNPSAETFVPMESAPCLQSPCLTAWINDNNDDGVFPVMSLNPSAETFVPMESAPCLQSPCLTAWINDNNDDGEFPVMSLNPSTETFVPMESAPCLPEIPKPQLNRPVKPMLPRVIWNKTQQFKSVNFTVLHDSISLDENENSSLFQELLLCSRTKYTATKMVKKLVDDDYESSSESANTDDYESGTAEIVNDAQYEDENDEEKKDEDHLSEITFES